MTHHKHKYVNPNRWMTGSSDEGGFILFTIPLIVTIVGILAVSSLRTTENTDVLAGNFIQRGWAIQAAEGGLIEAATVIKEPVGSRLFSSDTDANGVFSMGTVQDTKWRTDSYSDSMQAVEGNSLRDVSFTVSVTQKIGDYESDGGSEITSLDRGGASYASLTESGKDVVLSRLQSHGIESTSTAEAVVESLYVHTQ